MVKIGSKLFKRGHYSPSVRYCACTRAHPATGDAPATPRVGRRGNPRAPCATLLSIRTPGCFSPRPFLLPCVHTELSSSRGAAAHRAGRSSSPHCDSSRPRPPRFAPHLLEPGQAPARVPGTPPLHAMAATPPSSPRSTLPRPSYARASHPTSFA